MQFECKIIISEMVEKLVKTMAQNEEYTWWWMINLYPFFYQSPPTLMSSFSPLVGKINLHYIIWTIYFQHLEQTYFTVQLTHFSICICISSFGMECAIIFLLQVMELFLGLKAFHWAFKCSGMNPCGYVMDRCASD